MAPDQEMDLSQVNLEWLVETFSRELVERLDEKVRTIVRDEMAKDPATGATVSS